MVASTSSGLDVAGTTGCWERTCTPPFRRGVVDDLAFCPPLPALPT
eukprot:SAG25_NODE_10897_length_320_cov_0.701357_1_plen_45_part_10